MPYEVDPAVAERLRRELRLSRPLTPFTRGSAFVGHSGDAVLKLFIPSDTEHAEVEAAACRELSGRLPVPTPELLAEGTFEGHPYVLMRRLQGEELYEVWPSLTGSERLELGRELGELMRCLHRLAPPNAVPEPVWADWCAERSAAVVARQRRCKVPSALIQAIPEFLDSTDLSEGERGRGLVHTEIMLDHLLVVRSGGRWGLAGLFDFEPAMVLPLDYELSSVGLFFSGGETAVLRAVLLAAGAEPDRPGLTRRIMGLFLMHRYCNLNFALSRTGADPGLGLEGLAQLWFRA